MALTGCNSEELTSPAEVGNGKTTHVTLTVSRPTDKTRTTLDKTEDGRALTSTWDKDDQLVVINSANKKLGELTLEGDGGSAEGVFSGELTDVVSEGQYTLWYLGASNDGNAPYASVSVNDGVATVVNSLGNAKGCKVAGTFADLRRADLMKRDNVKLTVKGDEAYAAEDITLASQNAMAHFKLSGVSTFSTNDELTVSYGNYSYKVATVGTDIYLPLIPGNYAFTFNLTSGSNAYTATIGNNTSIVAGTYYSATTATAQGTGIEVTLKKVETSEPLVEGVGPVIEYGGKSWRFTRGNLKYTLSTDQWTILDNQAAYVNAGGLGVATSKETSNECKPGTTPDDIGLFAWGATGVEDAQKPWTLRHGSTSKPTSSYWPSFLRTNSTITNLVDPDASYVYDFGHAYMAKGRPANDKREYITPPAEVITALMKECFVQGATLKKWVKMVLMSKGLSVYRVNQLLQRSRR